MNNEPSGGFRTFQDLEVYQVAREFRKYMYKLSHRLPEIEKYALASQVRRAAVSLTNNIAEGHGRHHYLDQLRFLLQARGSLEELIDDLSVCADENYLPQEELKELEGFGWRVHRLINGYGRYLRGRKGASREDEIHESPPAYLTNEADPFGEF